MIFATKIILLVISSQLYICNIYASPGAGATFELTIVPTSRSKIGSYIELYGRDSTFYVVLRNRTKKNVKIWKESNSWGYHNLALEIEDMAGNKLAVRKKRRGWNKNYPGTHLIRPGEYYVFRVALIEGMWTNSRSILPKLRKNKKLIMSVIYQILKTEDSQKLNVWVGKIKSKKQVFHIFR